MLGILEEDMGKLLLAKKLLSKIRNYSLLKKK